MDHNFSPWPSSPDRTWFASGSPDMLPSAPSHTQANSSRVRKTARWNQAEHKVFIETCELVVAEGHRRGKCFSSTGWRRIAAMFNASTGKDWTVSQMKNYWNKLRTDHKCLFELLRCTGIEYRSGTGRIHAPDHWWEAKIKENPKYAKYRNINCSEIYDTYGRLFGDTGDSTKYALSPTKLSQRGFDLGTDSDREYEGDKFPINAEATDSSGSPVEGRAASSMNISGRSSGEKRKNKNRKGKSKKKMYGAREVSASLEQLASVGTDLASIARSHRKAGMTVSECVDELLSSGLVQEGDRLHLFVLWFLRDKDNRTSYCAAKTPLTKFKFIEYCFERDNASINRKE
ncbi:unnamed protein product [Fraxinus pennsylvanica]|uniref:Myb/SANT-like domain-containing protein n=1 Tax=Fraxinus pennsylvanica TaxID=56036 RepID=A0AAD2A1H0_9LAMI|nr:unnamed protein product [Fraxinus pennsylvanica]